MYILGMSNITALRVQCRGFILSACTQDSAFIKVYGDRLLNIFIQVRKKKMSQIMFHFIVWWLQDTIKSCSSLTFMIIVMTHYSMTVSVCLRGLDVRGVLRTHGCPLCFYVRTCCCWTRQSAFSQSKAWTTTPFRLCGLWSGLAHPHLHLYAPPRESLTMETTPPPAGQHWAQ